MTAALREGGAPVGCPLPSGARASSSQAPAAERQTRPGAAWLNILRYRQGVIKLETDTGFIQDFFTFPLSHFFTL